MMLHHSKYEINVFIGEFYSIGGPLQWEIFSKGANILGRRGVMVVYTLRD